MTMVMALLGFALLAAGTHRQAQMLFGRVPRPPVRGALIALGHAALTLSLLLCLRQPEAGMASIRWFGDLTLAALVVLAALTLLDTRRSS